MLHVLRLAVSTAAAIGAVIAPTGGATAALPGYRWFGGTGPAALPAAESVYAVRGSPPALVADLRYAVGQQRRYGVPVVWAGSRAAGAAAQGITVYAPGSCAAGRAGFTTDAFRSSPLHGVMELAHAEVQICPVALGDPQLLRATVLHELGHAVGLDHYAAAYRGHAQIMNPFVQVDEAHYQAGDVNGLLAVAANSRRLARVLAGG